MVIEHLLLSIERVHTHCQRVRPLCIAYREMQVEGMPANVLDKIGRIAHRQGWTVKMLVCAFAAIVFGVRTSQLRRQQTLHLVAIPAAVELDDIGKEAVLGVPHVSEIAAEVVQMSA